MKEIPETPMDKAKNEFVLEQIEEAVIVQEEETKENSVRDVTINAEEDGTQSPRQVVYEESDGIIQEANSLNDDSHKSSSLGNELASAKEFSEIEESSPSECEDDAVVDFSQPPIYDSSDEEDIGDFDQDTDTIEDSCKGMEEFTEEHKGVELTEPPETPIKRPLPPNTSFNKNFLALGYRPPPFTATDETAPPSAGPSSSTAAPAATTAPPPASEPVYRLVHRLFRQLDQMERRNQRRYERLERRSQRRYTHLKLMIRQGADIPFEPETPSEPSEEEEDEHEEETHSQAETHQQAGAEQAAPHQEVPHRIEAADPQIPIQSAPPLQQPDPQPTSTTAPPATTPTSDDTPSHPA
ncbi:uncharacterized protein LOC130934072 [Arachis stenosperma]|uniref:uncharacterized protein LOC130934072 n=1 Tax=Arachis stenosperma TaxID=217475 RepID=UPI0025AC3E33|nr:uncharacterized protein LOC130934072 [Arachis stenosperma]